MSFEIENTTAIELSEQELDVVAGGLGGDDQLDKAVYKTQAFYKEQILSSHQTSYAGPDFAYTTNDQYSDTLHTGTRGKSILKQ